MERLESSGLNSLEGEYIGFRALEACLAVSAIILCRGRLSIDILNADNWGNLHKSN